MKRIYLFAALLLCVCGVSAQTMLVHQKGGTVAAYDVNSVDSVCFSMEQLEITPERHAVDLGLSVMWAECNLGAETPADWGDFYSWGEVSPKSNYSQDNYAYYVDEQYQHIGNDICGTKYDAASAEWGPSWRMPSHAEVKELAEKCVWTWMEPTAGVCGYMVTGPNGRSIFLPASGYTMSTSVQGQGKKGFYWTGTLSGSMPTAAHNMNFSGYSGDWTASRAYGLPVRPVFCGNK